jgi:hypothetical protein
MASRRAIGRPVEPTAVGRVATRASAHALLARSKQASAGQLDAHGTGCPSGLRSACSALREALPAIREKVSWRRSRSRRGSQPGVWPTVFMIESKLS